ncbi:MAG: 5'/3'-nucleotidase SurE [Holosporaceae bacterium]|jgi:5'-nucleotidase|nr:5'/3'-nucleotidase SurE [Holosporaceae bacterium]
MKSSSQPLSTLRILISNDDSINADGIKALERIANSITPDVWVVAPEVGQSGKGFSVTFNTPLRVKQLSPRKFSVTGTPADCVLMGIGEILGDKKPDLVLSGINHGSNIADFIGISGTVGAAFAAASQDIKAIAISQDCKNPNDLRKFPLADYFLPSIIKKLMNFKWPRSVCMNINFPEAQMGDICGIRVAKQGRLEHTWNVHKKLDPTDDPYYWLHSSYDEKNLEDGSDAKILAEKKYITVTALHCRHEFNGRDDKLEELFASNA